MQSGGREQNKSDVRARAPYPLSPWTDEKVERLRELHTQGLSCKLIADALGPDFTRNSVIGKAARIGLPGRTPTTKKARHRPGPISFAEKMRREAERAEHREALKRERRERKLDGTLPPLVIVETPPVVEFLALTFGELQYGDCRYPRGEGDAVRFCGQPALAGHSYCKHCYQITHHVGPRHPLPQSNRETQTRVPAGEGCAQPARSSFAFGGRS